MLEIEVWSDYACPYCYIGKTQLKQVLADMDVEDVRFHHKVFVLEPNKVNRPDQSYFEGLNITDESKRQRAMQSFDSISEMANQVGLKYKIMDIPDVGTIDAHRLTLWAEQFGKGEELSDLIFKAYFEEAKDISNHDILCELAHDVGLEKADARECLTSQVINDRIQADFSEAAAKGIDLVPHFYFNGDHEVLGVTTKPLLEEAVAEALKEQYA